MGITQILGLFHPTTLLSQIPGKTRKRDPPHTTWGPPVMGIAMFLKDPSIVEVIL